MTQPDITKAAAAKAAKHLDSFIRADDGDIMTRRRFLETRIAQGHRPEVRQRRPYYEERAKRQATFDAYYRHNPYILGLSNPNLPQVQKLQQLKDAIESPVTEFILRIPGADTWCVITKTEYTYAQSILTQAAA